MRYFSFALVAGSLWAYIVPGLVAAIYLQRINQKDLSMGEKYPEYQEYKLKTRRLIPFIW